MKIHSGAVPVGNCGGHLLYFRDMANLGKSAAALKPKVKKVSVVLFKSIFFLVISGQNICLLFLVVLSILKNLRESGRTQVETKVFSQVLKVKKQN